MAVWFDISTTPKTQDLTASVLSLCKQGNRVQFLTAAGVGSATVQRMRVALSRARAKNRAAGRPIDEFTWHHNIYPYTEGGRRFDCVVMWIERSLHHRKREILDDLVERSHDRA